jgi:hypothetical protein
MRSGFGRVTGVTIAARILLLAVALLLAASCATPVSQDEVEQRLKSAGASVKGLGSNFVVVPVHADSKVAAWTLAAEARAEGSTPFAQHLSYDLRRGAERRRGVVVGGFYPDLTYAALVDAFELLEGRSLAGLTLVYVGSGEHAGELRQLCRAHRARFYHRELR